MSVFTVSNSIIKINVNSKGAELISLQSIDSNIEYLWQASPQFWGRHAPVLFPIVGRLKDDEYFYQNKSYQLSQHGFARDKEFTVIDQKSDSLQLELQADTDSLSKYPFQFSLRISYYLHGSSLTTAYKVENNGDDILPFSIGGHPGYACPFDKEEDFENYRLEFSNDDSLKRYLLKDGLLSGDTELVELKNGVLSLNYDLFEKDAIVLKDLKSQKIRLVNKEGKGIVFSSEGFPYFGIWTAKRGAPFICLEPWHGIADSVQHTKQLIDKEGIIKLKPGGGFKCEYSVEIL